MTEEQERACEEAAERTGLPLHLFRALQKQVDKTGETLTLDIWEI